MLEFEFNSQMDAATLVEFFARCGWEGEAVADDLEWVLANSEEWVLCRLDGELIGFGRSCRLGPLDRVVFDVMVDVRYRDQGLQAEIVRLLSMNAGGLEKVSVFVDRDDQMAVLFEDDEDGAAFDGVPWASSKTYLGRRTPVEDEE
jgi:hypothetical protein